MRTTSMIFSLLALLITLLSASFGAAEETLDITVTGRLIGAELKDADLAQVLKEIEAKTGVKISIDADLAGQKVNARFKELSLEEALKTILGENYALVFQKDPGASDGHTLKEVKAKSKIRGTLVDKDGVRVIEIGYGSGKDEVGQILGDGGGIGPKSFAVDKKGDIYILDKVNDRVQVFSPEGIHLRTIPLKLNEIKDGVLLFKVSVKDMALDNENRIYIFADRNVLYQFDSNGKLMSTTDIEATRWAYFKFMHVENNNIYVMAGAPDGISGAYLVGSIINGFVKKLPGEEQQRIGHYFGPSGRRYKIVDFTEGEKFNVVTFDQKGKKTHSMPIYVKGLVMLAFLGEDERGNFYIKTDRVQNETNLTFEVHKFSAEGRYIKTLRMSSSAVYFSQAKEFVISNSKIYEFKTEKDKVRIRVYSTE